MARATYCKTLRYGETLCEDPSFTCREVQAEETWESLWPDPVHRDLVQRVNRMNIKLRKGMTLAVPQALGSVSKIDLSPFPQKVDSSGEKQIWVDLSKLAWGAYDAEGTLVNWGPVSAGKDWCPDTEHACKTPIGNFYVFRKSGAQCKSSKFPIPKGGAPMPYCMFFRTYYALHGSYELPGYRASHGCVRIFPEDAKWLNENFVDLPDSQASFSGTAVRIQS